MQITVQKRSIAFKMLRGNLPRQPCLRTPLCRSATFLLCDRNAKFSSLVAPKNSLASSGLSQKQCGQSRSQWRSSSTLGLLCFVLGYAPFELESMQRRPLLRSSPGSFSLAHPFLAIGPVFSTKIVQHVTVHLLDSKRYQTCYGTCQRKNCFAKSFEALISQNSYLLQNYIARQICAV